MTDILEIRPDLGAATLEPSLREIVHGYYATHFRDGGSDKFADEYLAALSAATPPALSASPALTATVITYTDEDDGPDHEMDSWRMIAIGRPGDVPDHVLDRIPAKAAAILCKAINSASPAGWRSMDSAPKDGTRFLGLTKFGVEMVKWCDGATADNYGPFAGWIGVEQDSFCLPGNSLRPNPQQQPTHWMPLPPAPAAPSSALGTPVPLRSATPAAGEALTCPTKLLMRAGMLSGLARHIQPGKPMTREITDMLVSDANHILTELAVMGVDHPGVSDTEAAALAAARKE